MKVRVPAESLEAYQNADMWKYLPNIEALPADAPSVDGAGEELSDKLWNSVQDKQKADSE